MNKNIIHRGPDDEGFFINNSFGFGFRRLSIIDLSKAGAQPMEYSDGNVIIFNGEIYNYVEIKDELIKLGYQFKSTTDTEVILAAYNKWGMDCIYKFNGMWAFVLFDRKENKLFVSRDRFGIKPLYYWYTDSIFSLASEIKQFTRLKGFNPVIDTEMAIRFLIKGQLNVNEKTFFSNVLELRAGRNLIYALNNKTFQIIKYYDIENIELNTNISLEESASEFFRLFDKSVKIRLRSDVKVGSCLSGGLDSTSIVGFGSKQSSGAIDATISSCYNNKKYDEQEYIDLASSEYGIQSIKVFPNINNLIDKKILSKIIYYQDQPIKSTSHFSEYSVFESAKNNNLTVMLDGQGSDEFLAGYIPFHYYNYDLLKNRKFITLINNLKKQKENHYSLFSLIKSNLGYLKSNFVSPIKNVGIFKSILNRDPSYWLGQEYRNYFFDHECDNSLFDSYNEVSKHEIKFARLPYQLHSEDRNSMLHSIESRLPFLDFELADFMLSLPDKMKLEGGKTKLVLRESFKNVLPKKILHRHPKMGFEAPEEELFLNNSEHFRNIISQSVESSQGIIDPIVISEYDNFVNSGLHYNNKFFRIISYHLWYENFIG